MLINVINLILGSALLMAGRKLFWLFVGVAGFITGMQLATRLWQGLDVLAILVGFAVGAIFALLAIFLQTIAIGAAGFLAGGYILTTVAGIFGANGDTFSWIVYLVGGILGVILVIFLFDWALITLSSLAGAALVIQAFFPRGAVGGALFVILFLSGVLLQGFILRHERAIAATS